MRAAHLSQPAQGQARAWPQACLEPVAWHFSAKLGGSARPALPVQLPASQQKACQAGWLGCARRQAHLSTSQGLAASKLLAAVCPLVGSAVTPLAAALPAGSRALIARPASGPARAESCQAQHASAEQLRRQRCSEHSEAAQHAWLHSGSSLRLAGCQAQR